MPFTSPFSTLMLPKLRCYQIKFSLKILNNILVIVFSLMSHFSVNQPPPTFFLLFQFCWKRILVNLENTEIKGIVWNRVGEVEELEGKLESHVALILIYADCTQIPIRTKIMIRIKSVFNNLKSVFLVQS